MDFIGRKDELDLLRQDVQAPGMRSVLLYGRRRVGKSELIRQALKSAKGRKLVFVAAQTLFPNNLAALSAVLANAYGLPLSFSNLPDLLAFVGQASAKEKTIFVIDEYSYFREEDGLVDSAFQRFIDTSRSNSQLTLILSGSIVRIMKGLIEGNAPLYGRFDTIIALAPFSYLEAAEFYPERPPEEKFFLYATLGGIPHYLVDLNPGESAEQNLIRLLFKKNAALKNEAETLLNDELSSIENANAVLSLLGNRSLHYSEINQLFPSSRGNGATYILNKLLAMGLIDKSLAINAKEERNLSYRISDPFLRFYYAYYASTRSLALLYEPEDLYATFIKKDLESAFLPKAFEEVAGEFLIEKNKRKELSPRLLALGNYAYSYKDDATKKWINGEFDLVSQDERGYSDYECKYRSHALTLEDIAKERASVAKSKVPFYRIGFFSRKGYAVGLHSSDELPLYTLDDLYALPVK